MGYAIVKKLACNSDDLVLLGCRDISLGKKIAIKISANVEAVEMDLSSRKVLKSHISKIYEQYGRIDVLINNAGVNDKKYYLDISLEQFDETMRVNTIAPFELIRAVIPSMKKNKYGRIINISSRSGSIAHGLASPSLSYSLSKSALNVQTLYIAKNLPKYLKINCICPGGMKTRMNEESNISPEKSVPVIVWLANLCEDGPSGKFFYRDKTELEW